MPDDIPESESAILKEIAALEVNFDTMKQTINTSQAERILPVTAPENFIIDGDDIAQARGSQELKPCPHCGSWAFSIGTRNPKTNHTVYHVNCTGRDCMAQAFYCDKDPAVARIKAIERWNRRVE